tara:strand:+ start:226 stop:471 length:246 start_codon:yes stop_codon:yes gene_type:complete
VASSSLAQEQHEGRLGSLEGRLLLLLLMLPLPLPRLANAALWFHGSTPTSRSALRAALARSCARSAPTQRPSSSRSRELLL